MAEPAIVLTASSFDVNAAAPPGPVELTGVRSAVLATLNRYVEAGVLTPLRTGGPAGDLGPVFTAAAVARVSATADRQAFVDEGVPRLSGLVAQAATVGLTGLAGVDGKLEVVDAALDLRLTGTASTTPVTIARTGQLVLLRDAGGWRIDGYDIKVTREAGGGPATTAARK